MAIKNYQRTALTFGALAAFNAYALQTIEPVEGHNSFVRISAKETTRLVVEGGKIRSLIATDGELAVEKDEERGQLFLRPAILDKPINVRVITSSGATYNLIMQAVDVPQEDVVIREPFAARNGSAAVPRNGRATSDNLLPAVRGLITAMALEEPPAGVEIRTMNREFALWENTRFVMTAAYTERELVGEKYRLTNTGKNPMRLVEQELYRKGVVAVGVENMQLEPGQATTVYVVRAN